MVPLLLVLPAVALGNEDSAFLARCKLRATRATPGVSILRITDTVGSPVALPDSTNKRVYHEMLYHATNSEGMGLRYKMNTTNGGNGGFVFDSFIMGTVSISNENCYDRLMLEKTELNDKNTQIEMRSEKFRMFEMFDADEVYMRIDCWSGNFNSTDFESILQSTIVLSSKKFPSEEAARNMSRNLNRTGLCFSSLESTNDEGFGGISTGSPTATPSLSTYVPTGTPSLSSYSPTEVPTGKPSFPTGFPTEVPTGSSSLSSYSPTEVPTGTPSFPTGFPTELPTGTPSLSTDFPSEVPTGTPSFPTDFPTEVPTGTPSFPTEVPTGTPSLSTDFPTEVPTGTPTLSTNNPNEAPNETLLSRIADDHQLGPVNDRSPHMEGAVTVDNEIEQLDPTETKYEQTNEKYNNQKNQPLYQNTAGEKLGAPTFATVYLLARIFLYK